MNSIYKGKKLNLTIFGGSHEPILGFKLSGFPKMEIDISKILEDIKRRQPKQVGTTKRIEKDEMIIISGIEGNMTTGEDIEIHFKNENVKSEDYNKFYDHPRPGHVDFVVRKKYEDESMIAGGGIFSGRMTLPMVVAGSLCKQALNYEFHSRLIHVGLLGNIDYLDKSLVYVEKEKDSVGGLVEVVVKGVEVGLGGPLFQRLNAKISEAVFSIPGTRTVSFGDDQDSLFLKGSQYNDIILDKDGKTKTNYSAGISGGISNGNDIIVRVTFRPASSIGKPQMTYNFKTAKLEKLVIEGRHDAAYVRRVPVVVENMIALALLDEKL